MAQARLERLLRALEAESPSVLWEHADNVTWVDDTQRTVDVYVVVRHFAGSRLGTHVACAAAAGAVREYAVAGGEHVSGEHVGVYVYNPGVHANGALRFGEVVVGADTCTLVRTLVRRVERAHAATVALRERCGPRLELRFYFGARMAPGSRANSGGAV
jgi:hypothetical protein